jgi:hypothetical protein
MRNPVRVISLVEGAGRLGPSEPRWGDKGVHSVHLLLSDAALPVRLVRLGALEDHKALLGLEESSVLILGAVR